MNELSMETIAAIVLMGGFVLTILYVAMWKPKPTTAADPQDSEPR